MRKFILSLVLLLGLGAALTLGLVLLLVFARPGVPRDSILRITFDGALRETPTTSFAELVSGKERLTLSSLTRSIRAAAKDDRIRGLALDLRDPEVGLAQAQEIESAVAVFRDSGKWSAAYLETAGEGSAGTSVYALAVSADNVFLAPTGEIGLVGLRVETPFVRTLLDRLGIEATFEQRWEYKSAPEMFTRKSLSEPGRREIKALVDDLQQELIEHLAKRRKVERDRAGEWLRAGPFSAAEGLEHGLVDQLAYPDELEAEAVKVAGRQDCFVDLADYQAALPTLTPKSGAKVALIVGEGAIHRGKSRPGPGSGPDGMGAATISRAFRDAREAHVQGIVFRVDSPGGSYLASDLIRREVALTDAQGIPVVVSMGNVAASGGYFVAMGARAVLAEPTTITGSIGAYTGKFAVRKALDRWVGVSFDSYETSPNAALFSDLDPPTPQARAYMAQSLDRVYEDFVAKAAAARGMTPKAMDSLARGRVWSGRAAKEHGLVDELGGLDAAFVRLKELAKIPADQELVVLSFPRAKGPLGMVIDLFEEFDASLEPLTTLVRTVTLLRQAALDSDGVMLVEPRFVF